MAKLVACFIRLLSVGLLPDGAGFRVSYMHKHTVELHVVILQVCKNQWEAQYSSPLGCFQAMLKRMFFAFLFFCKGMRDEHTPDGAYD